MRGIYAITNVLVDTVYYGQGININNRFSKHKSQLRQNKHYNKYLQRSWNKYGENAFIFTPIQIIEDKTINLTPLEQKYIDNAYSLGLKVFNEAMPEDPSVFSLEALRKISETHKNKPKSEDHKKKLSETHKGKKHTEKWKQQNSERMKYIWAERKAAKVV